MLVCLGQASASDARAGQEEIAGETSCFLRLCLYERSALEADLMTTREHIIEADKQFLWHPYTPMDRYINEVQPLVIERAEGSRIFDVDGRTLLDIRIFGTTT